MIQVVCPTGPRTWVSTAPNARADVVASKAARLLGHSEAADFALSDRHHRIIRGDEPVIEGESYALVPLRRVAKVSGGGV